jgi:trehalose/maltose hydrolase-like predicted phosphorylase
MATGLRVRLIVGEQINRGPLTDGRIGVRYARQEEQDMSVCVGDHDRALVAIDVAARIDLDDLTGPISSVLQVAPMSELWQVIAFGFAGLRPVAGRIVVDPRHPPALAAHAVRVRFRDSRVRVRTERSRLTIPAESRVAAVGGDSYSADADRLQFAWCDPNWDAFA